MSAVSPTHLWFLNTLLTIRLSESDSEDHISILEFHGPHRDSTPMHIHENEDEIFLVLEGQFRLALDSQEHHLSQGDILVLPKGKPHTHFIESPTGGRWQTITTNRESERFIRAMSRPAERPELPEKGGPLTEETIQKFNKAAADNYIHAVGPPLR